MTERSDGESRSFFADDAATFGDRLAAAREALGLDQAELARRIGVSLRTLRAWEDDLAEPRANRLQMLAGVLNVSLVWLLTGQGEGVSPPPEREVLPLDASRILAEIRSLRVEMATAAERLAQAEKRLRMALEAGR